MALNTGNNGSFWNKVANKIQDVKNTVNQVNAENAKVNAQVKAVYDERILKAVGMNNSVVKNNENITNAVSGNDNKAIYVSNKSWLYKNDSDIDLQSDKFISANDEINRTKENIEQVKKGINDIMVYSKDIDDNNLFELTNDLNVVKNISDSVEGISGDLSSIKANLNIIDPDFGNNSFLFDMAWDFGSDLVKSKEENRENDNVINPLFGTVLKNNVNMFDNDMLIKKNSVFHYNTNDESLSVDPLTTNDVGIYNSDDIVSYNKVSSDGIRYHLDIVGDVSSDTPVILLNHGGDSAGTIYGTGGDYSYYEDWLNNDEIGKNNAIIIRYDRGANSSTNSYKLLEEVVDEYSISINNCSTAGFSKGGEYAVKQMGDLVINNPEIENPMVVLIDGYLSHGIGLNSDELKALGDSNAVVLNLRQNSIPADVDKYEAMANKYGINFVKVNDEYCKYNKTETSHHGVLNNYFNLGIIDFQLGYGNFPSGNFTNSNGTYNYFADTTYYDKDSGEWIPFDIENKTLKQVIEAFKKGDTDDILIEDEINDDIDCSKSVDNYNSEFENIKLFNSNINKNDFEYNSMFGVLFDDLNNNKLNDVSNDISDVSLSSEPFRYEVDLDGLLDKYGNGKDLAFTGGLGNYYKDKNAPYSEGVKYIEEQIRNIWENDDYTIREKIVNGSLKHIELAADVGKKVNYQFAGTQGDGSSVYKVSVHSATTGIDCNAKTSFDIFNVVDSDIGWLSVPEFYEVGEEISLSEWERTQPADIFVRLDPDGAGSKSQHVGLIVRNNSDERTFDVAESRGPGYGIVARTVSYDEMEIEKFIIKDMGSFYGE